MDKKKCRQEDYSNMICIEENCPLCQNEAKYTPHNFGRFKIFDCENCKVFVIEGDLIEDLVNLSNKDRKTLSLQSNGCPDEKLFVISVENGTRTFIGFCDAKCNW